MIKLLSITTTSLFFLNSSAAHRNIHSFPTRRSSDLQESLSRIIEAKQVPVLREKFADGYVSLFCRHRLDRKSTRLNSSHRCISYAVFCLKKKKKLKFLPLLLYNLNINLLSRCHNCIA